MVRKRSLASVLYEDDTSSDRNRNSRNRSISNILGEESTSSQPSSSNRLVLCNCPKCNGRLIDPRTKVIHDLSNESSEISIESSQNRQEIEESERIDESSSSKSTTLTQDVNLLEIEKDDIPNLTFLPRIRPKRHTNQPISVEISNITADDEVLNISSEDEMEEISIKSEEESADEFSNIFEDYSSPNYDPDEPIDPKSSNNNSYLWILLWIMSFRIKFNLPETATESLIKFIKLLLSEISNSEFDTFPNSIYMTKKELGLRDDFYSFPTCPKCHKLYNKQEVEDYKENDTNSIMKCRHVEFPNSATRRNRQCQTILFEQVPTMDRFKLKFKLVYPFAGIRQQLMAFYNRPNFENFLRHWLNRTNSDEILSDIYDGQIWKSFKETNDENSPNFFRNETADSHLGLMINLDWFQPYDGTIHSTGVIYAAICNLPRDIRFKHENLLILGLLPGPNEVSLHKINHYLAPIVDELESLWNGIILNGTDECPNGKKIRAALILVSCDVPAARKICGHISALVSCHRCEKKANYENRQHNFAGMDDMDNWFIAKDSSKHLENALRWRGCNSDSARKKFTKSSGVRWSELLRLPYFDPIRFITVDPMHCLFLGIAKWIVKRIWVDMGVLSSNDLNNIQKKMNEFQVPADLGRIPGKIYCGEGFSNFTADQWRIFISIYATVVLWEYLEEVDRKILTYFVRICHLFVNQILETKSLDEIHKKIVDVVTLIEKKYGRNVITPNLHLSLHLSACSHDFGPLYAFWCFSFERMNGILGKLIYFDYFLIIFLIIF